MRDYTKLDAFQAADALAVAVYEMTRTFPSHEKFGLTIQLRRAVVSAAANVAEEIGRKAARATLLLERLTKRARGFRAADARRSRS